MGGSRAQGGGRGPQMRAAPMPATHKLWTAPGFPFRSFSGILHGAWNWFPMGLVMVNEQTLASCLSSPPLLHSQAPAGLRWLGGWGEISVFGREIKNACSKQATPKVTAFRFCSITPAPTVLTVSFSWSQNKPLCSELFLKAQKKHGFINYNSARSQGAVQSTEAVLGATTPSRNSSTAGFGSDHWTPSLWSCPQWGGDLGMGQLQPQMGRKGRN